MERGLIKGHGAVLGASIIFGANYWIAKGLMPSFFTPLQVIFIRVSGAMILFWLASLIFSRQSVPVKDLLRLAGCSVLGVAVNQICFFEGLNLTTPIDTSIIHASSPVLVLLFSTWFIKEALRWRKVTGVILGGVGTVILVLYGHYNIAGKGSMEGNLLILLNISAYSAYLVLIKPLMMKYRPVTVMKWVFLFGFLASLPFTLKPMMELDIYKVTAQAWYSLLYVVLGTTFLAYLLTIYGLKYLTATAVGFYIYIQPLVAVLIGWVVYNQSPGWVRLVAAVLIFWGVYLVNRSVRVRKDGEKVLKSIR